MEVADIFDRLKDGISNIDPVAFAEKYLTIDGKPFNLTSSGWKPFADIYRYIGVKALEKNGKPVILVKGRQVGGTVMANVIEQFFMGSGVFGVDDKPPVRIIHAFPILEQAAVYSKTQFSQMINNSKIIGDVKKGGKPKSYMQNMLDTTTDTNNSIHFKQFKNNNYIFIDSLGVDADRIRGRTADAMFIDECFPYEQNIETINGKEPIGKLYEKHISGEKLPLVKTFNELTEKFEYKEITNAWTRGEKNLVKITCGNKEIKCTPNHRFLTYDGWKRADELSNGELIKTSVATKLHIRSLNDDQFQVMLGSFLGDGNLSSHKNGRYRVRVIHGIKQSDYCKWKAWLFQSNTKIIEKNGYAQTKAIKFNSKCFGLGPKNNLPKNKTFVPQWVLDQIDARAIAIWFMDDGSIGKTWNNGASATLSTCSFDEDSQKRIVKKFKSIGIDCKYKLYDGYYYIVFNKNGCLKLFELIAPYLHDSMKYKTNIQSKYSYIWNNEFKSYGFTVVDKISELDKKENVYDIEVRDNHNFILAPSRVSKNVGGPIAHNCQDISGVAISNATKILTAAKYGPPGNGVQVYFGTPKRKGSDFHKMWQSSTQQYFHLGCEKCKKHFPLYTPDSDEWEKIWLHGFIVKCTHCGQEQDKRQAAQRGKWVGLKDGEDSLMIGFHINQLYIPYFTKEKILSEKPGTHPINTERAYKNEVLGEFYQGDTSPITMEEIHQMCGETDRKMTAHIPPSEGQLVIMGIDYGARADLEQMANPEKQSSRGQSYSTAVIMSVRGPNLFSIDFALKFKRNDMESKKGLIEQMMKQYSVKLAIGDIGFSQDFSETLHQAYGDKYLVSRAQNKVNNKVKYNAESFPKEIVFERDHYIGELFELMKKGQIKFPYKDYDKIGWLVSHCSSMEIKPSISKFGDPTIHYVKGSTPNDGLMALLNAYIAYKFLITKGFTENNPLLQNMNLNQKEKPPMIGGYIKRNF